MRLCLALAALSVLWIGRGAEAAPTAYEGNFTSRDCMAGGGFLYCGADIGAAPAPGYTPGGMRFAVAPPAAYGIPSGLSGDLAGAGGGAGGSRGGVTAGLSQDGGTENASSTIRPPPVTAGLPQDGAAKVQGGGLGTATAGPSPDSSSQPPGPSGGGLPAPAMTPVPEPGALAAFGAGLAFLGVTRRRAHLTR